MSYPSYRQPVRPPSRNSGCGCWILVFVLIIAGIYSTVRYFVDQDNYTKAHSAYIQNDCDTALNHYDSVVNSWRIFDFGSYADRSQQERAECQAYTAAIAKQSSSDPSGAVLAYSDFIHNHGTSLLASDVHSRIQSLVTQTPSETLATEAFCDQFDYLQQNNFIPTGNNVLPDLMYQCGQMYFANNNFLKVVNIDEEFLSRYPNDPRASDVESALARSIVASSKSSSAGTIPAPNLSGITAGGSAVVIARNDSPNRLRIALSGPDGRVEELPACASCTTYSSFGPLSCPDLGPVGRYTVTPGQYDVVVQSISDTSVTPWTGTWNLGSGDEYSSCFFMVTTTVP